LLDGYRRWASRRIPAPFPRPSSEKAEPCDWCLVGNIVQEHAFGEQKVILEGSKHFTPGTKVYCLPAQWGDGYQHIIVVGICRRSRRWIKVVMDRKLITNWRAKMVYKPVVLGRLRKGHSQWKSKEQVEWYVERLRDAEPAP
jgi:hypothetical protein